MWAVGEIIDGYLHVWPLDDKREHVLEGVDCPCEPRTALEGATLIVTHNAFDFRDVAEWLNEQA
jgi:hypothetical protein